MPCDQGFVLVVVDLGQVGELGARQRLHRGQEALVARLGAEPQEPREQTIFVVRLDRADTHPGLVPELYLNRG